VTRLRPHETRRKDRQINVTFPSEAWTEAVREIAKLRGLRPGDFIVWCVSYAIAQIQDQAVTAPSGQGKRQHHKACEWMDLPLEPGETKERTDFQREKPRNRSRDDLRTLTATE